MSFQDLLSTIEIPDREIMGPAMLALNPRQRRFVCALAVLGGKQREAYKWAGYEVNNDDSASASACRLAAMPKVQEAIREEAWRRMDSATLLAVSTLVELASADNNDKKLRKAAADSILDRTGFGGKTEHQIVIKDERTTKDLIDFIRAHAGIAQEHGIDVTAALGLPKVPSGIIDAEFSEVVDPEIADMI